MPQRFRSAALLFLLAGFPALLRATGCISDSPGELVKTSFDSYFTIALDDGSCGTDNTKGYSAFDIVFQSFSGGTSVDVWPGADSGVHTANPATDTGRADMDGNGTYDGLYHFQTNSLQDLGTYTYAIDGAWGDIYGNSGSITNDLISFPVYNSPPSASISITGEKHVGHNLQLGASGASDPDGGSLSGRIQWTAMTRPAGTPDNITNASNSLADLNLTSPLSIGHWSVRLQIGDNEGQRVTMNQDFDVPNQPPDLTIDGDTDIDALTNIQLSANSATDPDGETLSFVWDILSAPAGASLPAQNHYRTEELIDIPTGPHDIGDWQFRLTATDGHMATDTQTVTVHVHAIPPQIHLEYLELIRVGDTLDVHTTIVKDAYGGDLAFNWELMQTPVSSGEGLSSAYRTTAGVNFLTTPFDAGTWRLKLTVTDQVDQTAEEEVLITVDADPTAVILGPDQTGNLLLPLDLDGTTSYDPDSPDTPPDYGHLYTGSPQGISLPEIQSYQWSLAEVPPEYYGDFYPGPVADVFNGVDGNGPTLHIPANKLRPGDWLFQLVVRDAEGNESPAVQHWVQVLDENLPPTAVVLPPQSFTLASVAGVTSSPVAFSGGFSFDLDNILTDLTQGISHYKWEVAEKPPLCPGVPSLPDGDTADTATLFAAGEVVSGLCQGAYKVQLTVTDDDTPSKTGVGSGIGVVTNCATGICIDYPTNATPQFVKFVEGTDVVVSYHVGSDLYDQAPLLFGLQTQLQVFHEGDLFTPFFDQAWDMNLLPWQRGGVLEAHWDGFGMLGERPAPGKYTVAMRVLDPSGISYAGVSEPEAIWIQVLDVTALDTTDKYVSRDWLMEGGTHVVHIDYQVDGSDDPSDPGYDEIDYRLYEAGTNNQVVEGADFGPFDGHLSWNGNDGGGVVATGVYDLELEIYENGASLGKSPRRPFTVYHMGIAPDTAPVTNAFPGVRIQVNDDDDNQDGLSDIIEANLPAEDDLVGFTVTIDPPIPGTLQIAQSAPALVLTWTTAQKAALSALPVSLPLPASLPVHLFMEGVAPGQTRVSATIQTPEGLTMPSTSFALTIYDVSAMNDADNNFTITGADAQTFFVRPGLWDNAFRVTADAFGASSTTYNQQDDARIAAVGNPENFVGRDSRRFYFKVADPAANANAGAAEEVTVDWYTLKSTGPDVNDDFPPTHRAVHLRETGADTGVFVSPAVMLVTDTVDVTTATNTGLASHPGLAAYDADDHRTRKISSVNSLSRFEYKPTPTSPVVKRDLPAFNRLAEERGKMTVHVFNFADPLNLGIAATPQAVVDHCTAVLKERYVQIGIDVNLIYNPATDVINLPAGSAINLNAVGDFTVAATAVSFTEAPSADQTALINMVRAVDPATPANADVLDLVFLGNFGARGESLPDGVLVAGSPARNFVFVAGSGAFIDYSPAHEIGHMLTNATLTLGEAYGTAPGWAPGGHFGGAQDIFNLMHNGTSGTSPLQVDNTKRYWDDTAVHTIQQITRIRGTRFIKPY